MWRMGDGGIGGRINLGTTRGLMRGLMFIQNYHRVLEMSLTIVRS